MLVCARKIASNTRRTSIPRDGRTEMGARAFIKSPLACNGPRAVRAGFEEIPNS